ncbi:Scr1 family TA system antitoxin-like transcriptional regulator [Streptomyces sp. KMM 9044]|uniref:Scr1 family TA system antitoxin-like transcriptional regulator n=1 Tax=Streptomyces sp. KMM 9044 TaxID=2744474 RepID=UPI002F403FB1
MGRRELLDGEKAPPFRTILSEAVLRTPLRDAGEWRGPLEYLAGVTERPNVTVQALPLNAGLHGLTNATVMFLRLTNGRSVACTESGYRGDPVEENARVERLHGACNAMRDLALSPAESRKFALAMWEEELYDPWT